MGKQTWRLWLNPSLDKDHGYLHRVNASEVQEWAKEYKR